MAGARHFSQLIAWQLADALRVAILELTHKEPFARDWKFRRQVEDASDSVCRNIAEGFGSDRHKHFAWYLRVSRSSLNELRDALRSVLLKGYATPADLAAVHSLIRRLQPCLNKLIRYLDSTPDLPQSQPHTERPKPPSTDQPKAPRTDKR